jgi:hypothetical protein
MEEWMKMHRFGKRGGALAAVAVVALAVGAGAAFGTASSASKARSAKSGPPVCAKVGYVPGVKAPANCKWVTPSSASTKSSSQNPTSGPSFRSIGALVGTGGGNTCTIGVSGVGLVCTDLGGGLFEIDFPPSTYIYPTLGIPTMTPYGAAVDTLGFVEFLNFDGSASLFVFLSADVPFTFTNTAGHF